MQTPTYRKATIDDLPNIVTLLSDDELGKTRELKDTNLDKRYLDAFHRIDSDSNQYLMIVMLNNEMVGTCHLTFMPSLTFTGATRMQIEAVRIAKNHRGKKIGEWMMDTAFQLAQEHDVSIIQLTTNKKRPRAKEFYERLGFETTHKGMKYYFTTSEPHE